MIRPHPSGFTFVDRLVLIALLVALAGLLAPAVQRTRHRADLALCKDNLRRIGAGLLQYARASEGALPVSPTLENPHVRLIECLVAAGCVGDPKSYYCPSLQQPVVQFTEEHFKSGTIGYYYYAAFCAGDDAALSRFLRSGVAWPRRLNTSMPPRCWVMSDIWLSGQPTAHAGYRKGLNYLMLDGSVEFVGESPRQAFH